MLGQLLLERGFQDSFGGMVSTTPSGTTSAPASWPAPAASRPGSGKSRRRISGHIQSSPGLGGWEPSGCYLHCHSFCDQPSRGCLHSAPPVRVQPRSACRDPARPRVEPDGICACPRVRGGLPVPRLPRLTSKANQREECSQPRPSLGRGWLATWTYFEPDPAVDRWSACKPSTRGETGRVLKRHRHSRDDEVCQEGSEIVAELGGGSGPLLPTIWSSSSDGVTGHASRRPRRNDVDQ